jgi:membrane protein
VTSQRRFADHGRHRLARGVRQTLRMLGRFWSRMARSLVARLGRAAAVARLAAVSAWRHRALGLAAETCLNAGIWAILVTRATRRLAWRVPRRPPACTS